MSFIDSYKRLEKLCSEIYNDNHGDDEFPPNAQVLYTDNFADCFAAEDRVVAGDILISHIKAAM